MKWASRTWVLEMCPVRPFSLNSPLWPWVDSYSLFTWYFHFSPEYLERKRESAVLFLLSSTSVPLNLGCMETPLLMLTLPPMRTSGWRGSGGWKQTIAMKMVSLNLFFHGEISKREVAIMWSWTNGEESMGATQWRPGVLRALQDVFREGEEGDQVPYIHALDSDHTDLRCFLNTVLFLSSAASLLLFIYWDSFIHSFVHLEDFIEGQLGIRHRSTHWDVSVNKTDKTICSDATCIPDKECNDVNYEACWKVVSSVGQQRRKWWAFQVSVGWLAWPSWKWLLSTDLNVGVKHLGRNNRAKEMQVQRFWPRSLRGAAWVRGEERSGSQRCMGGAAAEGRWDLWDYFKGFALCSEWEEKPLEDFEQKNNVIHLTFWQHSSGCCVQVRGKVGIEGRSKETSEEVLEWLRWERMAAWTKMIAGWRWEWEGFWIHFDGRANRILLSWAERKKESSQGCLLYAKHFTSCLVYVIYVLYYYLYITLFIYIIMFKYLKVL